MEGGDGWHLHQNGGGGGAHCSVQWYAVAPCVVCSGSGANCSVQCAVSSGGGGWHVHLNGVVVQTVVCSGGMCASKCNLFAYLIN